MTCPRSRGQRNRTTVVAAPPAVASDDGAAHAECPAEVSAADHPREATRRVDTEARPTPTRACRAGTEHRTARCR